MDRLNRTLAGCGLALWLATSGTGCRSTRSEVPPGPMHKNNAQATPAIGFSQEPHPIVGAAPPISAPYAGTNGGPQTVGQLGTPPPGATANFGAPTSNIYGPPGSSPLGRESAGTGSPIQASSGLGAGLPTQGGAPPAAPALPPASTPGDPGTQFPPQ